MDFKERLKRVDWKTVAILALIFVLAFGIRGYLLRYDLMFEFDTYWHTRMTGEIIQHGVPPTIDPLAYYQLEGGSVIPLSTQWFWYISAFFYYIAALFSTASLAYNKELLIQVVKFLPAIYGAITALGLYFLGKEAYGKNAGYLMAFFGAVSASFIYRSMAGFFEAGTLGYVFMVFGFYFVLRAVKRMQNTKEMAINGVIAGILLGALANIYALFLIVPIVLVFYLIFTSLSFLSKNQFKEAIRFAQLLVGILVVFVLMTFTGPNQQWINDMIGLVLQAVGKVGFIVPVALIAGIGLVAAILFFVIQKNRKTTETVLVQKEKQNSLAWVKLIVLYLLLVGLVILMVTPKVVPGTIHSLVGEESPGHLYFFHKFSILLIFPILALALAPLIDFKKRNVDAASMLLFPFILISWYMAWDRLHYSYNLGVPLAIAVGYVLYYTIRYLRTRAKSERVVVGFFIGFIVFAGVASATLFTQNNTPTIELDTGWKEGLLWLKDNAIPDAKVFNWWDEGHWITFIAEVKAITDNRNNDAEANANVGKFVLTEDLSEAIAILKKYDSDYLLLGADLFSKRNSMVLYGYYSHSTTGIDSSDPRLDFVQSIQVPCFETTDNGQDAFHCSGAVIPKDQFSAIPTQWTSQPSGLENERNPIFYYRTTDNGRLYKLSLKQNNTIFAKIWFKEPSVSTYFEEVFPADNLEYRNKELKIFKIKKEEFPTQ
ncbi:glycosyltransferase family 39 protein [Candidatus Micrarchaeota archaeon]|nr:glycosyltransferase family 39 protein [Candidatus Micrarchaeota archaeon]MBU1930208.1 glycosyltransferase family 39 protein [Candidatus Micrarchaeota archaeon]